jgi:uncharacterized protein (DUF1810 family)
VSEPDPFDLARFVGAQDEVGTYQSALAELRRGSKAGHWMWFVFPQIDGLGFSPMSRYFGIKSLAEARAYLAHPTLGTRLRECAAVVDGLPTTSAGEVFGSIDAVKLRSSMTLFLRADPTEPVFQRVLDHYFDGVPDPETDRLL